MLVVASGSGLVGWCDEREYEGGEGRRRGRDGRGRGHGTWDVQYSKIKYDIQTAGTCVYSHLTERSRPGHARAM